MRRRLQGTHTNTVFCIQGGTSLSTGSSYAIVVLPGFSVMLCGVTVELATEMSHGTFFEGSSDG